MNGGQTVLSQAHGTQTQDVHVLTLFVGMVHIQQGEVVSINVCKPLAAGFITVCCTV